MLISLSSIRTVEPRSPLAHYPVDPVKFWFGHCFGGWFGLEQVDFWLPADDSYYSPMPKDPQHHPANLVD
jgi:hypothetical protein